MAQPASSSDSGTTNSNDATLYRIDITQELIKAMEGEIRRFKDTVQSRDVEIQELKGKIENLKQEMEAIPITRVTERNLILESQTTAKQEEVNRLNERLQVVLSKDGTQSGRITMLTEANTMLEKRRIINVQTIQKCKDTIEYRDATISQLNKKLGTTEGILKRVHDTVEKMEAKLKILEEENRKMTEDTSLLKAELAKAKNDEALYVNRMNELQQYEEQCGQKEQDLHTMLTNTLPDKERTISALTVKVTELEDYLETISGDTIPRSEHSDILRVEVDRTRDALRETYREEYQTRVDSLEAANTELERKLAHVEGDLRGMEDKRDELLTATEAYKHLVNENVVKSDTIIKQKQVIADLNQELQSCKERMGRMTMHQMNQKNKSGVW